jgi:hypothetical protein
LPCREVERIARAVGFAVRAFLGRDRHIYARGLDAVKKFDLTLDVAAIEYKQARELLNGASLVDAALLRTASCSIATLTDIGGSGWGEGRARSGPAAVVHNGTLKLFIWGFDDEIYERP